MRPLIGRVDEVTTITDLVERAREGLSGTLVLRGEAGIGKTRLLEAAAERCPDFDVVRLVGIESEMRLGYAGLHLLLAPYLGRMKELPPPQGRALESVFGLRDDAPADPFLVGLAALTLITDAAAAGPARLVIVDDAQWLDTESAEVIGFLARRLYADRVCLLIGWRTGSTAQPSLAGLPTLPVDALSADESTELLNRSVPGQLVDVVRARLLSEARGNPLALVEMGRSLSADELAGTAQLPTPLAMDRSLEGHFLRQFGDLPASTRRLLLVASAEVGGRSATIWHAGQHFDFTGDDAAAAQEAGLLDPGSLTFRHPLIRSAVYQGASTHDRMAAHAAIAAACEEEGDGVGAAWHRGASVQSPDDHIAANLDDAAHRAGGRAASASLFTRSAELTPDRAQRAVRYFMAAGAELVSGGTDRARDHLAMARPDLQDPVLRARALQLEALIAWADSFPAGAPPPGPSKVSTMVPMMLEAARALEPLDHAAAREVMLEAVPMAIYFRERSGVPPEEVIAFAHSLRLGEGTSMPTIDLVLDALTRLFATDYASAAPQLRRALTAARTDDALQSDLRGLTKACWIAFALSDDDALRALAGRCADLSREQGAYRLLPEALDYLAQAGLRSGRLEEADAFFAEAGELHLALSTVRGVSLAGRLIVSAWRGDELEVRERAAALTADAKDIGLVLMLVRYATSILELGLGQYAAAARLSVDSSRFLDLSLAGLRAADAVEAHVRAGDPVAAQEALSHLEDRAVANQSSLDLGLLARSRALLSTDASAEDLYLESVTHLLACGADLHAARTRLVFGEWLRRQRRRLEARAELQRALADFEDCGAAAFAERARVELLATGAHARKRVDSTRLDLTPQEAQIARLAATGHTNSDIAARMFISASTVDYHLRKVYRKLNITSRHEIAGVLADA